MKRFALLFSAVLAVSVVLLPGCRDRIVYTGPGDWLLLAEDPDDGNVAYNAGNLYVDNDFTDNILTFKVETFAAIPDARNDVQFAVLFDTDQDASTGLSASNADDYDPPFEVPNDIGADYMMFVGMDTTETGAQNENQVFTWNDGWDTTGAAVLSPYQPSDGDSVKGGVSLLTLGSPAGEIDLIAVLLCDPYNTPYFDHVPDQGSGHLTLDLESGTLVTSPPYTVTSIPQGRTSLLQGKPRDSQEVR